MADVADNDLLDYEEEEQVRPFDIFSLDFLLYSLNHLSCSITITAPPS